MVISKDEEKVLFEWNCCTIELVVFVEESQEGEVAFIKECSRVLQGA